MLFAFFVVSDLRIYEFLLQVFLEPLCLRFLFQDLFQLLLVLSRFLPQHVDLV